MPLLKIEVSTKVSDASIVSAIKKTRQIIHEVKGDPLSMIEVAISTQITGVFGSSESRNNIAHVHLTSFRMTPEITAELTRRFSRVLWDEFGIAADSAYIIFTNIEEPHMTGWNGRTFSDLLTQKSGIRQQLDRRIFGRLVSAPPLRSILLPPIPLGGLLVELWNPMAISLSDEVAIQTGEMIQSYLGRGFATNDGFFEVFFENNEPKLDQPTTLELRIYEPDQLVSLGGDKVLKRFVAVVHPVRIPEELKSIPIGHVNIGFYEYDPEWPFPYALPTSIRQGFSSVQEARFESANAQYTPILRRIATENESVSGGLSIDEVQMRYPANKTITMGTESRIDAYFCDRILNALVPPIFQIDPIEKASSQFSDPNVYVVDMNWKNFERRADLTLLSFKARFVSDGEQLVVHDILLGLNNEDEPEKFTKFTPSDGDQWQQAKRIVRATYNNVAGQLRGHLAATHFGMEQFTIAFLRNIRNNPIRQLLYPYVREVLAINEKGRYTLIGGATPIVYLIMPMTTKSINKLIVGTLGQQDWCKFKPRAPICENHGYAKAANLFWSLLEEMVENFFKSHQNEIAHNWEEIFRFSNDLVENSLPYVHPPIDQSLNSGLWYCSNEIIEDRKAGEKSLHTVTSTLSSPSQVDLDNLKQVCSYMIYNSTFVHSWIHKYMRDDLGEIRYSGLLRNGGMGDEQDDSFIAPPALAALSLNLNNVLGSMNSGSMIENEDGDGSESFIEMLKAHKDEFKTYGLPIEEFSARLNT
jgi:Lipoxygenase/Macrophage migration inhibitory factor (MIF)